MYRGTNDLMVQHNADNSVVITFSETAGICVPQYIKPEVYGNKLYFYPSIASKGTKTCQHTHYWTNAIGTREVVENIKKFVGVYKTLHFDTKAEVYFIDLTEVITEKVDRVSIYDVNLEKKAPSVKSSSNDSNKIVINAPLDKLECQVPKGNKDAQATLTVLRQFVKEM